MNKYMLVTRFERVLETSVRAPEEVRKCVQILNDFKEVGPFEFDEADLQAIRWAVESDDFVAKYYPGFTMNIDEAGSKSFRLAILQLLERRVASWTEEVIHAARAVPVEPSQKYLRTADGQELLLDSPLWFGAANSSIEEIREDDERHIEKPEIPSDGDSYWAYSALNS